MHFDVTKLLPSYTTKRNFETLGSGVDRRDEEIELSRDVIARHVIERTSIRDGAEKFADKITDLALRGRLDKEKFEGLLRKEEAVMRGIGPQDDEASLKPHFRDVVFDELKRSRDKASQEAGFNGRLGVAHFGAGTYGTIDASLRYNRDTEWVVDGQHVHAHGWAPLIEGGIQGVPSLLLGMPLRLWSGSSWTKAAQHLDNALELLKEQGASASRPVRGNPTYDRTYERKLPLGDVTAEISGGLVRSAEQPSPHSAELARKGQEAIGRLNTVNAAGESTGKSLSPLEQSELAAAVAEQLRASNYLKVHGLLAKVGIRRSTQMGRKKNFNAESVVAGSLVQAVFPIGDAIWRYSALGTRFLRPAKPEAWTYAAPVLEAAMTAPACYEVYSGILKVKAFMRTAKELDNTQERLVHWHPPVDSLSPQKTPLELASKGSQPDTGANLNPNPFSDLNQENV